MLAESLLYVALTRARDYLVIPCLPGEPVEIWLGPVANPLVRPLDGLPFGKREKNVTWFDSRRPVFGVEGPLSPSVSLAVDGSAADGQAALAAEGTWLNARRAIRKKARVAAEPIVNPSRAGIPSAAGATEATGAQRLYGPEREEDLAELSEAGGGAPLGDNLCEENKR